MSSDELTTIAQKAARGGLFLFVGNTFSTVILAVGAIIVARLLGPFSYGLYTLTVAIPVLLVALADAGMKDYAMSRLLARLELHRYIARRRKGTDKLVSLVRAIGIVQGNDLAPSFLGTEVFISR
jgi:O-antigen/teichoic acid export membrane protein